MTRNADVPPVRALRLVVDPVACDGVGMCARLAPDLIALDTWGYPVLSGDALSKRTAGQAARAVAGCPKRALMTAPIRARATTGG